MNFLNNNNNQFNNINGTPQMTNNESYRPMYKLNDIVYNQPGKVVMTPAVNSDSGIPFNNSLIVQPSPKRPIDQISYVQLQTLTINPTIRSSSFNVFEKDINDNAFGFLGQDLSLQITQQQLELDILVSHHMERMKMEIELRKKNQLTTIIEESISRKFREKEEELSKIGRMNLTLEEKVKSLYIENQLWRELAETNEETANALRTNLEQTKCNAQLAEVPNDAVSCCGHNVDVDVDVDEGESKKRKVVGEDGWIYRGKKGGNDDTRLCRKCGEGETCVLILPCRHLCVCMNCGPTVNFCPVCFTVKSGSVNVNLW